jgi:hypothetical protein
MKHRGINYDVGTRTLRGGLTREIFETSTVSAEIDIIRNKLNCTDIRISGIDIGRLVEASTIALQAGLTVWFSPSLPYEDQANTLEHLAACAAAAERLRLRFGKLVFVAGCELTLFTSDLVRGKTWQKKMASLFGPVSLLLNKLGIARRYNIKLNKFLHRAAEAIRARFHGQIAYASGTWEKVDWELFDLVGIDHYRSVYNKSTYLQELHSYFRIGKPVCIMEFGCCSYNDAGDKGAMGWAIADWKKQRPEIMPGHVRDEEVQSRYLLDLLNIFDQENVHAAFVFTFASYNYIFDGEPDYDLDMAAYGIVRCLAENKKGYQGLGWEPKQAFYDLARYYGR